MKPQQQLDLGGERVFDAADYDEHELHLPMALILDPEVSGEALAVFAVMKSFGKRAHASLDAYAERLGWGSERVQNWQKVLVQAAWMTLLQEGKAPNKPRLWWLNKDKNESPPLGAFASDPRGGVLPALVKSYPRQNTPPKQGLSSNLRVSSKKTTKADALPWTAADGSSWQDLIEDYLAAFRLAKADPEAKMEASPADFKKLKTKASDQKFTRAIFQARLKNMGQHEFHRRKEFSLGWFCDNFKEFDDNAEAIRNTKTKRGGAYLAQRSTDFEG